MINRSKKIENVNEKMEKIKGKMEGMNFSTSSLSDNNKILNNGMKESYIVSTGFNSNAGNRKGKIIKENKMRAIKSNNMNSDDHKVSSYPNKQYNFIGSNSNNSSINEIISNNFKKSIPKEQDQVKMTCCLFSPSEKKKK